MIITQMNLDFNKIGDEGAAALAKALEKNTSITQMYLGFNSRLWQFQQKVHSRGLQLDSARRNLTHAKVLFYIR